MKTPSLRCLKFILVLLLLVSAAPVRGAEKKGMTLEQFLGSLTWTKGPGKGEMKDLAEIKVPAGFMFTGEADTQKLLRAFGNPTNGRELGLVAPTNLDWFVVFEFADTGFIKDDDKDKLDADAMLKSIQKGTEAGNEERKKMGGAPLTITGWQQPPKYNPETHNLEWAIKGESEGHAIVNYNTRLLGRKGVMEVALVVSPDKLPATMPDYQALLKGYAYKDGQRYAEFRDGDKVAQYGLAALVVGGAAVGAAKLGLFAVFAGFFKKAWKLVVVGVVALGSFIKKLFTFGARRSGNDSSPGPTA